MIYFFLNFICPHCGHDWQECRDDKNYKGTCHVCESQDVEASSYEEA